MILPFGFNRAATGGGATYPFTTLAFTNPSWIDNDLGIATNHSSQFAAVGSFEQFVDKWNLCVNKNSVVIKNRVIGITGGDTPGRITVIISAHNDNTYFSPGPGIIICAGGTDYGQGYGVRVDSGCTTTGPVDIGLYKVTDVDSWGTALATYSTTSKEATNTRVILGITYDSVAGKVIGHAMAIPPTSGIVNFGETSDSSYSSGAVALVGPNEPLGYYYINDINAYTP